MNLAGKTQRKNAAMLDSDDDNSSVSSSSTMRSDRMSVSGTEEVEFNKDSLLDEAVDALFEKRLELVICLFNNFLDENMMHLNGFIVCCGEGNNS